MKRFAIIDFMRGFAIFGVVFVHVFSDLFNQSAILSNLDATPLSFIIVLLVILYLGTWGGMFVMISATGNMFSMYNSLERGKSAKDVALKQIVGGFILLFFSMLVEGVLQRYAFLGTLIPGWGPIDPTRIIWHAYSMTPVHCLSVCMIINGIIQGILSRNKGYLNFKRNIIVYAVLGIIVLFLAQPVWDLADILIPGYPNAHYPSEYGLPGDYTVCMPLMGQPFFDYIGYFLLLIVAGGNTPILPFLFSSFIGNIIGLLLIQNKRDPSICKKGMIVGLLIFISGIIQGLIVGAGLDEFLPLSNSFADITGISDGLNGLWYPWFAFQNGGQVITIFLTIRLIEFRGKGKKFAEKTTFIRRFGIPAFTIYAFHRFFAIIPVLILSWISGVPYMLDDKTLTFEFTMLNILFVMLFIHLIMKLWEKIGYIGSLEWGMGVLASLVLPNMPKAKSALADESKRNKKIPWYELGKMNMDAVFYKVDWQDLIPEAEIPHDKLVESKMAMKLSIIGILIFPIAIYSLIIARKSTQTEQQNKYNKIATILSIIDLILGVFLFILLSTISLSTLNISL